MSKGPKISISKVKEKKKKDRKQERRHTNTESKVMELLHSSQYLKHMKKGD